jgi:squalene-hopene/tetraprenyl-beta-curcumene cyclase
MGVVMSVYLLCLLLPAAAPAAPNADAAEIRSAVEKALPYLMDRGQWWIDEKKCITCHRIGVAVWGLHEAARRGFDVDREKLAEWTKFSLENAAVKKGADTPAGDAKNPDGASQLLLGLPRAAMDDESRASLILHVTATQQDDGSWKPAGQLPQQKRPAAETTAVSTIWQALALTSVEGPDIEEVRTKALAWIDADKKVGDAKSTEWFVVRLLLAKARGATAEVERLRDELLKLQHNDGGWGWLTKDESDALATGMALYALAEAGLDGRAEVVRRVWKFLADTQQDDGSWAVKGTKTGKKDKVEETATYWGAAWAVLGIARTLPE